MRLSLPHLLLVWSGHVESPGYQEREIRTRDVKKSYFISSVLTNSRIPAGLEDQIRMYVTDRDRHWTESRQQFVQPYRLCITCSMKTIIPKNILILKWTTNSCDEGGGHDSKRVIIYLVVCFHFCITVHI